eukprot:COSAG05_NODE_505_length_9196_cov_3.893591_10_plen_123_part_00
MPMATIESLVEVPADRVISFSGDEDLEKYITLCLDEGGGSNEPVERDTVLSAFEHYMWSLDGSYSRRCCLNTSSWIVNHAATSESPHVGVPLMCPGKLSRASLASDLLRFSQIRGDASETRR